MKKCFINGLEDVDISKGSLDDLNALKEKHKDLTKCQRSCF